MTAWQTSTSDRIGTLERDHRFLLTAFGAAFVFLIVMFAAGYLSLSAKLDSGTTRMDAGFDRIAGKVDLLASDVSDLKADVAVLKSDAAPRAGPTGARQR
jgi:outer membrane murein-binding lipoprotein Lpp